MDAGDFDLCKENIQPLRQGRRVRTLGLALQAQTDHHLQEKLLKEREERELSIITYDGDDPLGPRYEYVQWVEQHFPSHGLESNLIPLLEDTIMMFKDDDRYKQDVRFIQFIIKYIQSQDNAAELYQMVYSQGVGTTTAIFYKAWAEHLDMCNNLKRADKIYVLGIENKATPLEVLEEAHKQFQLSVGRRMMLGDIKPPEEVPISSEQAVRQRQVLGKLKKSQLTSIRPSHGAPGKLPSTLSSKPFKKHGGISVYEESENDVMSKTGKLGVLNADSARKENTVKTETWSRGYSSRPAPTQSTPGTSFQILTEDDSDKDTKPLPVSSKALKTRKIEGSAHCALSLFQSPYPNKTSNVPTYEMFGGGREFCYEELRWAYYQKHKLIEIECEPCETPSKPERLFPIYESQDSPSSLE